LSAELGPRHSEVRRLRALLRDRHARAEEHAFVVEGPRGVASAFDRDADLETIYLGYRAGPAFAPLVAQARERGIRVAELKEGVLEKVGATRTPQPVLAVVRTPHRSLADLGPDGPVVVAVGVSDPGNVGTIVRCAEAAGAGGVVTCANSVDVHNPKAVRSSAGAIFAVTVVEADDPVEVLQQLSDRGPRIGTRPSGAAHYESVDLSRPCSLVLGNEAHGLPDAVRACLDGETTIPMAEEAESLNVAMAATVLLFESARQRRLTPAPRP
jgi:TrmH family RNA methyltransferase